MIGLLSKALALLQARARKNNAPEPEPEPFEPEPVPKDETHFEMLQRRIATTSAPVVCFGELDEADATSAASAGPARAAVQWGLELLALLIFAMMKRAHKLAVPKTPMRNCDRVH